MENNINNQNQNENENENENKDFDFKSLSKPQKTGIIVIIVAIAIVAIIHEFCVTFLTKTTFSIATALEPVLFGLIGLLVLYSIVVGAKQSKKQKEDIKHSADIFENSINHDIFKTSENLKETSHKAEHVINNEKCEVIIEKPTKKCSFCGASNPTSAKHCDCCGKRL